MRKALTLQNQPVMIFILLFASLCMLIFNASMMNFMAVFATPFHALCLSNIPTAASSAPWIASIVCADRLGIASETSDLQTLGLIHMIVVSGCQLFLIESAMVLIAQRGPLRRWMVALIPLVLLSYAGLTGFQVPILRALIHLGLRRLSSAKKLFWRPAQITLLSGLLTFICAPSLTSSLSLQLGWLASLAFCSPLSRKKFSFLKHALLYAILFLPLLPLGVPHPISVFCNWLLTPFLSVILFPLSAATVLIHALSPLTDFVWSVVSEGVHALADMLSPIDWRGTLPFGFGWFYLACLQLLFLFAERPLWGD